eukprot:CAMPEP_0168411574 /NCGR_PEP_ID=MMETSP0228-20121227/28270_1 /TAXON_ID=133427 /ORGANISM="Protoceratium reticulatum, Strain CCCM 535 (=CCMP 1889)" /LENGTH=141 /DNA_ID=CAMNT_0008425323 /DNA_START=39 /DNA_END=460 /DNA_ORIENTATION=-
MVPGRRAASAASALLVAASLAGGSDPCFAAQQFGTGFGLGPFLGEAGPAPRVEGGEVLVEVAYEGCTRATFEARLHRRASREGSCALALERGPRRETCAQEKRRWRHAVRVGLPADAESCRSLLLAYPPGQRFEYYRLRDG